MSYCYSVFVSVDWIFLEISFLIKIKERDNYFRYCFQGVGTVVSGTTLAGTIRLNDTLLLGPDALGRFAPVAVRGIHRKRMPVPEVRGGQTASFALKKVT